MRNDCDLVRRRRGKKSGRKTRSRRMRRVPKSPLKLTREQELGIVRRILWNYYNPNPNPCKTFMLKGFCRFGTACKYSNRISKETEEQNKKIESLEEIF